MEVCEKPWGKYATIFEEQYCKVKQIVIKSGEAPSYQYHFNRSEVWIIVQGVGTVKIDGVITECKIGDTITVPVQAKHQIKNTGSQDLIFIEIQLGDSFEESDIVRVEDKYGRL